MEKQKGLFNNLNRRLDTLEERLKDKELVLPTDIIGAGLFFLFAVVMLLIMPNQISIAESDVVNGRMFPTLLLALMIICSVVLLINSIVKIYKKQQMATCTLHLLTEIKALIIMAILGITYGICSLTDLFVVGAVFCALSFLLYFRCSKWIYYVITIGLAIIIWCAFRFVLGIRF